MDRLLAAYQHNLTRSPPAASLAAHHQQITLDSHGLPKRTVLSVVTSAYAAEDPSILSEGSFDPLLPGRGGLKVGLPKNSEEFWKMVEAYLAVPGQKELEALARIAWPEGEELIANLEAAASPNGTVPTSNSVGSQSSSSQQARASRRGPAVRSVVDEARAARQAAIEALQRQEEQQQLHARLNELLTHAAAVSNSNSDGMDMVSNGDSASAQQRLHAAWRRFVDSRLVARALEAQLSIRLIDCNEEQLITLMRAIWNHMQREQQTMVSLPTTVKLPSH
jgi:hypothetical protein